MVQVIFVCIVEGENTIDMDIWFDVKIVVHFEFVEYERLT